MGGVIATGQGVAATAPVVPVVAGRGGGRVVRVGAGRGGGGMGSVGAGRGGGGAVPDGAGPGREGGVVRVRAGQPRVVTEPVTGQASRVTASVPVNRTGEVAFPAPALGAGRSLNMSNMTMTGATSSQQVAAQGSQAPASASGGGVSASNNLSSETVETLNADPSLLWEDNHPNNGSSQSGR